MEKLPSALHKFWSALRPTTQRLLTAAILAPIFLASIYIGGLLFSFVLIIGIVLSANEWIGLTQKDLPTHHAYMLYGSLAVSVLVCDFINFKIAFLSLCVFTYLLKWLLDRDAFKATKIFLGGIFYLGLPAISIIWLRQEGEMISPAYDWAPVMVLFLMVWATDTFAYFAGRKIGGPKLAPTISPKKTISGLLGGMLGSAVVTMLAAWLWDFDWWGVYFVIGLLLAIVAQIGDLFESWLKRRIDVKDSGTIIPGHGGLLDRIDGLLTAAPVFAFILAMIA